MVGLGVIASMFLAWCVHAERAGESSGVVAEYVGSTPCDTLTREFLGGLSSTAACHAIAWRLTLLSDQKMRLSAEYRIPPPSNPNQIEAGPKVSVQGTWSAAKGARFHPDATVYTLLSTGSGKRLSFVKISDGLLHMLNPDKSLAAGTGGWSYTLSDAKRAEKPGDVELALAAPSVTYKLVALARGSNVFGVFEGRSPCLGISRELKRAEKPGCIKVKWRLTLLQDPKTAQPTNYRLEGSLYRDRPREGTWAIVRGSATDPDAVLYRLDATASEPTLYVLKGDDNVVFFLDPNRSPMIGHAEFSYTLNRVADNKTD